MLRRTYIEARAVRTRGGDNYEVVLLLVVTSVALTPFESTALRSLVVALLGLAFVFSFWTSGASTRAVVAATVLAGIALALVSTGQTVTGTYPRIVLTVANIALCAGAMTTIISHLAAQAQVTRHTVSGALSVYLLIGLLFANLYALIAVIASTGFFAQSGRHVTSDYVYFSYVTLTTVGYGDLTAGSGFGRMMAILEALLGQLYLVTIVAVVVGNIGRARSGRRDGR